jgi:hypothetical protein
MDDGGHFRDACGLSSGDWVLIRPDGYIGTTVGAGGAPALERSGGAGHASAASHRIQTGSLSDASGYLIGRFAPGSRS